MLDNLHIRLFTVQWVTIQPGWWKYQKIQSSFWRLYFNDNSGAWLELEDALFPLEKEQIVLIPAGVVFSTNLNSDVGHFYIHFDLLGLSDITMKEFFDRPIALPVKNGLEDLVRHVENQVQDESELGLLGQLRVKALLYEALAYYLQSLSVEQLQRHFELITLLKPISPALEKIETHIGDPLSIVQLAKVCHMSEDYFIRRFRQCVGQTPTQYILNQRVKKAAQLLLFTEESLEVIADQTGFGNRNYFSRVFTRYTGSSPAAYRKTRQI